VLMICDPRLISKHYGKRIWQSLPPFKRTRDEAVAVAFFKQDFDKPEITYSDTQATLVSG
jgi:ATP-dependent DNA helicase DinG